MEENKNEVLQNLKSAETLNFEWDNLASSLAQESDIPEWTPVEDTSEEKSILENLLIQEDQALEAQLLKEKQETEASVQPGLPIGLQPEELASALEAILFMTEKPASFEKLQAVLGPHVEKALLDAALLQLSERYQAIGHGIELAQVAGGYQLRTKPSQAFWARKLVHTQIQKLSAGALEALAIIAYQQPIMKEEVDQVRGVDSSYFVRTLLNRKLIKITGRSELPGRPILYGTTSDFLEIFGLADLSSLPSLRELEQMVPHSQVGHAEEEDPRIQEMRRMVSQMKTERESVLNYDPKEDEKILQEMREKVAAIPTSTPHLEELKAAELAAKQTPSSESPAIV